MKKTIKELEMMSKEEVREYCKTRSIAENFELARECGIETQEIIDWLKAKCTDADAMRLGLIEQVSEMIGSENVTQELIDRITKVSVITANLWQDVNYERFIDMTTDEMKSYINGIADEASRMAKMV